MTEPDEPIAAVVAARAADDKLAANVIVLEVGPVLAVCDHFVIASGASSRQVRAISEEVERRLQLECGVKPLRTEGRDDATWILLDYGDLIVHVFLEATRRYYDLERLWSDVGRLEWIPEDSQVGAAAGRPADLEGSDPHP